MNCPRCKNSSLIQENLTEGKITIEVDSCKTCDGIWFDKNELFSVDKIIEPTFFEVRHTPNRKSQLEALYCPVCSSHPLMKKTDHPRDMKVVFDYCPECKGIWLDGGELQAIQKENWFKAIAKILSWLFGNN